MPETGILGPSPHVPNMRILKSRGPKFANIVGTPVTTSFLYISFDTSLTDPYKIILTIPTFLPGPPRLPDGPSLPGSP